MTYAIIETGGKQLRVEPGRFYDIDRLGAEPDTQITLDQVLFVQHEGEASIGQPFVEGAVIEATILQHLRGRKILVYKMRPKKKTRKKQGHRQELTRLMINTISLKGELLNGNAAQAEPQVSAKPTTVEASVEMEDEPETAQEKTTASKSE
jgi:large subunit ribosomal protein L21